MPMEVVAERMASSLYLKMARANLNNTLLPSYRNVSHIRSIVWTGKGVLSHKRNLMKLYLRTSTGRLST